MSESLNHLVARLKEYTPVSRPSYHSKPWWSPHLTILRRECHKAAKWARKHNTPHIQEFAGTSKAGYFKAIKAAKNKHWSSLLLTATSQSLWTAKRFACGRAQPCFPSLPRAETPNQMNDVLLDYFFPPKEPFSPQPTVRPHRSVPPPNGRRNNLRSLQVLSDIGPRPRRDTLLYLETGLQNQPVNPPPDPCPIGDHGVPPASLKGSHGVVLARPGKPFYGFHPPP